MEHFGHFLWRDTDHSVYLTKIKTSLGDILVTRARKDIWARIENINDPSNAMAGLISIVERLMHSSILCSNELRRMWQSLEQVHNMYGGFADTEKMQEIIMIRLEEHCRDVRNSFSGTTSTIPGLFEWQSRSEPLFHTLREDVKATSRTCKAVFKGNKGESTAGMESRSPQGIDTDGPVTKYKRGAETGASITRKTHRVR